MTWRSWLIAVLAGAPTSGAKAEDVTLAALIDESLAARPELRRAEARLDADRAREARARALPDPTVTVGIQNDGFTSIEVGHMETSFVSIGVAGTIPWPGKRGLAAGVEALARVESEAALERARRAITAEVRRGYLELLTVRERERLLGELERLWDQSREVARIRYEAGDGAQSDLLRADLETRRLAERRIALRTAERRAVRDLNARRGRPSDAPIDTATGLLFSRAKTASVALTPLTEALSDSPELRGAAARGERARRGAALARLEELPDLTVGAAFMFRGTGLPPMWSLSVGAPLPVFGRQARVAAERGAEAAEADGEVEELARELTRLHAERADRLAAARETVRLYERGLLVASAATAESTLSQYKIGRTSFSSVLEANAGLIADREGHVTAVAEVEAVAIEDAENLPTGGPAPPTTLGSRPRRPTAEPARDAAPMAGM